MSNLRKAGGYAAIYEAAAYIAGMVIFLVLMDVSSAVTPEEQIDLVLSNLPVHYVTNLLIYVLFGFALVVLSLAIHDVLKRSAPSLSAVTAVIGIIWAGLVIAAGMVSNVGAEVVSAMYTQNPEQATTIWLAVDAVFQGLGGGNEIVGGLWVLLISIAGLRSGVFSKFMNYLGFVVGAAGLLSAIPILSEYGGIIFRSGADPLVHLDRHCPSTVCWCGRCR